MRVLVGTGNENKIREIRNLTGDNLEIVSPLDISLELSIIEDGTTLQKNAIKKGLEYYKETGICSLGEDTGLFVCSLGGRPGVHSARYSGGDDSDNRKKLLEELAGEADRRAYFKTVMAFVSGEDRIKCFTGRVYGKIVKKERGEKGFGYDSLFQPEGYDETFGEMDEEEKSSISHRRRALEKVLKYIEEGGVEKYCK